MATWVAERLGWRGVQPAEETHRYPYCAVWTPIPLISWVMPHVGHCGVCDSRGVVYDFCGKSKRHQVGRDAMLFGWPTRVVALNQQRTHSPDEWDTLVHRLADWYDTQRYDFVSWNCHSLVASTLNQSGYPPNTAARWLGGWTVASTAMLFFSRATYVGTHSAIKTYGPYALLWALVLSESVRCWSIEPVVGWIILQLGLLAACVGWFGLLALARVDSQRGICRARDVGVGEEDDSDSERSDDESGAEDADEQQQADGERESDTPKVATSVSPLSVLQLPPLESSTLDRLELPRAWLAAASAHMGGPNERTPYRLPAAMAVAFVVAVASTALAWAQGSLLPPNLLQA